MERRFLPKEDWVCGEALRAEILSQNSRRQREEMRSLRREDDDEGRLRMRRRRVQDQEDRQRVRQRQQLQGMPRMRLYAL